MNYNPYYNQLQGMHNYHQTGYGNQNPSPQTMNNMNYHTNINPQPQSQSSAGNSVAGIRCVMVDNLEDAQPTFDGKLNVYPSKCGKFIYTKKLGLDGLVKTSIFKLHQEDIPKIQNVEFVRKEEFNSLEEKVNILLRELGVGKDDEPNAEFAQSAESKSDDE